MSIDLSKLKVREKTQTEYIGARIDTETKAELLTICKSEKIKSLSALIYLLLQNFIAERKADKSEEPKA